MSVINFINDDCMNFMRDKPDKFYKLAIVDPPYGIDFAKTYTGNGWIVRESKEWDKESPNEFYFSELFRVSENQMICGANYMTKYLPPSMGWIFWDKGQREFSLADGELLFTSFNRALRVFTMPRGKHKAEDDKTGGKIHPTQKPIQLYRWLLQNYAKHGDNILDTHGGSMSSAIACDMEGFDLDICELDKEYFDAGVKRFNEYKRQLVLF